jgi:hypothetical protein
MAKWKRTNNDLQNITQETKDRATWIPMTTGGWTQIAGNMIFKPNNGIGRVNDFFSFNLS